MDFRSFERRAYETFENIPTSFREGIGELVIEKKVLLHPLIPDYYTLGECVRVPVPLAETARDILSEIRLYYGSFKKLRRRDPDFDWEAELEETIRHEIRHHLEDRAGVDHLGEEDFLEEQNERRRRGLPFTAGFHRLGERIERSVYQADGDLFLEIALSRRQKKRLLGQSLEISFEGKIYTLEVPWTLPPCLYLPVCGGEAGEIVAVLF